MPPALPSDDEEIEVDVDLEDDASDDLETIPAKRPAPTKSANAAKKRAPPVEDEPEEDEEGEAEVVEESAKAGDDDDDDDDDDDEDGVDVFAVEKILGHDWHVEGHVLYQIKWLGYDEEEDLSWEPEENLIESASETLHAYWKEIGGKPGPKPPLSAKKGRGKRKAEAPASQSPAPAKKGRKPNGKQHDLPPAHTWETKVKQIVTIEEDESSRSKSDKGYVLRAYVAFDGGQQALINMSTVRQNCPQKLLDYYEAHLSFREGPDETAGVKNEIKNE